MTKTRDALRRIKALVCGDAAPHWLAGMSTTKSRIRIADICDAALAEEEREEGELVAALRWALPLAISSMEDARLLRLEHGHNDIRGTYSNGSTWAGIHQSEIDAIESARAALAKHPSPPKAGDDR